MSTQVLEKVDDTTIGAYKKYRVNRIGQEESLTDIYLVLRLDKGWAVSAAMKAGEIFFQEITLLGLTRSSLQKYQVVKMQGDTDPLAQYLVLRLNDGTPEVLAARKAAYVYAKALEEINPFYSTEIEDMLKDVGVDIANVAIKAPGSCGDTSHFESKKSGGCGTCASGSGCSSKLSDPRQVLERSM